MKNIQDLTNEELLIINGGDGFWYDVAYLVGAGAHAVVNAVNNIQHTSPSNGGNATWADK